MVEALSRDRAAAHAVLGALQQHVSPPPQVTRLRWFDVVDRSTTMSTRAATMTAILHLHALAEIARLRHGVDVDVRIVSIPSTWVRPAPGRFNAESMDDLADIGARMGSDPASWSFDPAP